MLTNGLSALLIGWVLFNVVVIDHYSILIFAALNDAFGKYGTLTF